MDKLKMLKDKKKGLSDNERDAKMSAVEAMRQMAQEMMGDKLHSLKKVTVAAPDKAGLAHGLDKAKELIAKGPGEHEHGGEEDSAEEEAGESPEMEASEHDPEMEALEEETHEDLDHDNEEGESDAHKEKVLGHMESHGMDHHPMDAHGEDDMDEEELNAKLEKLMAMKKRIGSKKI